MTARALRSTAQRVQVLAVEASDLEGEINRLVRVVAPWLLELPGMGPISAGQVLVCWSHAAGCARRRLLPRLPVPAPSRPPLGRSPAIG